MALPRMRMRVWIEAGDDKDPVEHEVTVKHVDRLTAEVQLKGLGLGTDADGGTLPLNMMTAWAWAAAKREGLYGGPLARFLKGDCADIEQIEDDVEVPPTTEGPPSDSA